MSLPPTLHSSISNRLFYVSVLLGGTLLVALAASVSLGPVTAPASAAPFTAPAGTVSFDFDDDNKADIGRWHGTNTEFKVRNSNGGSYTTTSIGATASKPAPGDFDGDDKFDPAVFNAGTWNIKPSGTPYQVTWGQSGDIPVVGDYEGDGKSDVAVWRPSNGTFYVEKSSGGNTNYTLGQSGDIPMPGDYDNDAKTDYAVWRPSNGNWYIQASYVGFIGVTWGASYDTPVHGDFDGDGKDDPAVYRPTTGTWYFLKSSDSYASYTSQAWGNWGDQPVPADYDGDGKADLAVWRPTTGHWWIDRSYDTNYENYLLGVPGDIAIPSSFTKQVGGTATADALAAARLSPKNATGGTNLYSQNFSWGTNLVSLPGRSGLDASLSIGYNSLVWVKSGTEMYFDPEKSRLSPGFTFGLPVIEPAYLDSATSKFSFLMVTPSGGRTQFRQTTVSNVYEAPDSSYAQLITDSADTPNEDPAEDFEMTLMTTDGTQMRYEWIVGAYRCIQIKDRNGNYITAAYSWTGDLTSITDTLGRVINVNYNTSTGLLESITQTWRDGNGGGSVISPAHSWATFTYTTKNVDTDFDGLSVVGPPNDTSVTVLEKITYADTSWTKFHYNGYLQVWKVENYADNDAKLNHVRNNLASPSSDRTDCPRFIETASWAKDFNVDPEDTTPTEAEQEVVVTNSAPENATYTVPGGSSQDTSVVQVEHTDNPTDGLYTVLHFGRSGWSQGLPVATRDCIGSNCASEKRWTWTNWTQDNTGVSYLTNPRVTETRVGDGTNTKKTTISYGSSGFGLPETITVGDLSTVFKTQTTTYNLATDYTWRRIIGLPAETKLYEGTTSGPLMSKVTYAYDEGGYGGTGQSLSSATQHDTTTYSTSFAYRGNLTRIRRWDVTLPTTESASVTSTTVYNIAGSPISRTTPWDGTNTRTVRIGYTDNFNSTVSGSTYAYPTTITDPAGSSLGDTSHSTFLKYRYDFGGTVETIATPRGSTAERKTVTTYWDDTGRLKRNAVWLYDSVTTTWGEHSYTRYEYPSNGVQFQNYTPIINADGDADLGEDEVLTESWTDGAGRVIKARTPHTFDGSGATTTWSGVLTEYDILGRIKKRSVPTQVNSSWAATGDDSTILWTHQKYDWKNRVIRKVDTDGSDSETLNDSDVLFSYEGCGCAGGQVTTIEGELVPRTDTSGYARRKQKVYEDILGRVFKTETFAWNGSTVYLRTEHTFNGRDQITQTNQTEIATSKVQTTTATYDGHGRLKTKHIPQQATSAVTTYNYNPDDSILSVVDARSATLMYTYNSRGLVTKIETDDGSSEAPIAPTAEFTYDNVGNRTQMTDGLGTQSYVYNSLSQIASETRLFNTTHAPTGEDTFTIGYTYALTGQLKSLTEPFGVTVNYTMDKAGRLTTVAPSSSFGGVSTFASNAQYRAWGALKHLEFANGLVADTTFNNRLQPASHEADTSSTDVMEKTYQYYADGRLKHIDDALDAKFDRLMTYDHQGRIYQGKTGSEANGSTGGTIPYRQTYTFNAFDDMTERENLFWNTEKDATYEFENHRVDGWAYDADGRVTASTSPDIPSSFQYNAAGQLIFKRDYPNSTEIGDRFTQYHDGDGRVLKRETERCLILYPEPPQSPPENCEFSPDPLAPIYFIRSTVLGGEVISDLKFTGDKQRSYVLAGGSKLAELSSRYTFNPSQTHDTVHFYHQDASGMAQRVTRNSPETLLGTTTQYPSYIDPRHTELDPMGGNVGTVSGFTPMSVPLTEPLGIENDSNFINGQVVNATQDGIRISLSVAKNLINTGNIGGMLGLHEKLLRQMSLPSSVDIEWPPWETSDPISITVNRDIFGVSFDTDWLYGQNPGRRRGGPSADPDANLTFEDDCALLVRVFRDLAKKHANDWFNTSFVQEVRKELIDSMNPWSKDPAIIEKYNSLRSSGFKGEFTDEGGSFNQVRHFAGAFVNAYYGGLAAYGAATAAQKPLRLAESVAAAAAVKLANNRETDNSAGDMALNGVAAPIGVALAFGSLNKDELADEIRSKVCK